VSATWLVLPAPNAVSVSSSQPPLVRCCDDRLNLPNTWRSATRSASPTPALAAVGSRGDSYDNALAESFNGLYETEVIRPHGPWRGLDDVEYATLEYVDWFNQRRLHGEIGMIPPAAFEVIYYHQGTPALLAVSQ
jgi:putative transposase